MDLPVVLLLLCMAASGPAATYSDSHHCQDHHPYLYSHTRHHHEGSDGFTSLPECMVEEGELVASSIDTHGKKDLDALLSFKNSITADPYGILFNWTADNSETICSSWYGIRCRLHTKRVLAIELVEKDLEGTLSPSIGNFSLLHSLNVFANLSLSHFLNFFANSFAGIIPPEFGKLKVLQTLNLSRNSLSDPIPAQLGLLKVLRTLDLSENMLSSSIPAELGRLQNLQSLALDYNYFSGRIPRELGNLTQLTHLSISRDNMLGSIPCEIFSLPLQSISLYQNFSVPEAIVNLTSLTELYI